MKRDVSSFESNWATKGKTLTNEVGNTLHVSISESDMKEMLSKKLSSLEDCSLIFDIVLLIVKTTYCVQGTVTSFVDKVIEQALCCMAVIKNV